MARRFGSGTAAASSAALSTQAETVNGKVIVFVIQRRALMCARVRLAECEQPRLQACASRERSVVAIGGVHERGERQSVRFRGKRFERALFDEHDDLVHRVVE